MTSLLDDECPSNFAVFLLIDFLIFLIGAGLPSFVTKKTTMEESIQTENREVEVDSEGSGQGNYPKSSWRVSEQKRKMKFVCTPCGKEFKSNRALFGHMRCHSTEERRLAKLQSQYQMENPTRKRRSKRKGYSTSSASSLSNHVNFASPDSDDDQELEDIAQGLLMLSYGTGLGLASATGDISDHDFLNLQSIFFTTKAAALLSNFNDDGVQIVSDDDMAADVWGEAVGLKDVNSSSLECADVWLVNKLVSESCGFHGGLVRNESCVMVKFEVDVVDRHCCKSVELKKPILQDWHGGLCDANTEQKNTSTDGECHTDSVEIDQTDSARFSLAWKPVTERDSSDKPQIDAITCDECKKKDDFKCMICCKSFESCQALRGHRLHCPVRMKSSSKHVVTQEVYQGNTDTFLKHSRRRTHECPICSKAFQSGHALGGHMRSHFASIRKKELIDDERNM